MSYSTEILRNIRTLKAGAICFWWRLLSQEVSPTGRRCVSYGTKSLFWILSRFVSGAFFLWELDFWIRVSRGNANLGCLGVVKVKHATDWNNSFLPFSLLCVTLIRRLASLRCVVVGSLMTIFVSCGGLELPSLTVLIQAFGAEEQLNRTFCSCRPLSRTHWVVLSVSEGFANSYRGVMLSKNWDDCGLRLGKLIVPPCSLCSPLGEVRLVHLFFWYPGS